MPLDINKEIAEMQAVYNDSPSSKYIRLLQFGDYKSGKTSALATAPRPIFIDSWDPGGTKVDAIQQGIKEGWIIADNRWESEDPTQPSMFELFDRVYRERKAAGFFQYFATYSSDSLTMMSAAAMNYTLKKARRVDMVPVSGKKGEGNDYVSMQARLMPMLRDMLNLPCHVIFTAHPDLNTDEFDRQYIGPMVTGKMRTELPIMLDEIYYYAVQRTSKGIERKYLTQPDGRYRCGSRLASNGKIDVWEEVNIREIIKKGGFEWQDKEIPWLQQG